ncbi:MAG: hypothetical protein DRH33_08750 [Candidatus Nealsonbacteria bacterium]|nr:MAG: hypothetical protein DRH33_08750 [Candidatus Nealsonbacteria bacterium]
MVKNKKKILAIDPGTRHMGYAFLDKGKLLYYGVKIIEKGRSPSETLKTGRKQVLRLINDLKPNVLAVEKTFISNNRSASLLNVFFDEIKAVGKRKGLKVLCFAPSTVKKHIAKDGWADKKEVAKAIATKYPELKVYLTQDRGWKERSHQNMFDAVALAEMALRQS